MATPTEPSALPNDKTAASAAPPLSTAEVLANFEAIEEAIATELQRLDDAGELPVWRAKINRAPVLRTLGISQSTFHYTNVGKRQFERHDALLRQRGVRSRLEELPELLEKFLHEHGRARTLEFADGRINRSWALAALGHHSPALIRNPKSKEVFEKCDRAYAHLAPTSNAYPDLARRLEERILKGDLPVFKDRLNVEGLARELGVRPSAFGLVPECGSLLKEANHEIRFKDPCRPYSEVHDRNYNFVDLLQHYGRQRTIAIGAAFLAVAEGCSQSTAKALYRHLRDGLVEIADCGQFPEIVQNITNGVETERARAKDCLRWYRDKLNQGEGTVDTVGTRITNTRNIFEKVGILREGLDVLQPSRRGLGRHLPKASLAEARNASIDGVAVRVSEYARLHKIDFDEREINSFLGNLAVAHELEDIEPAQIPKAIEQLNRRRMDRIYNAAVAFFSAGVAEFLAGQEALEAGALQAGPIKELLGQYESGSSNWADVHRFFAGRGPLGLEAYLYYVEERHGGKVPRAEKGGTNAENLRRVRLNRDLGGPDAIQNKLNLSADAIGAACLMYLISAGANGSVGRTLSVGCVQPSTIAGHKEIAGWKARAGGKPIYNDLPFLDPDGRPTAVEALEFVQKCQPRLARHSPAEENSLFLIKTVGVVKPLPEHTLLDMLRRFVSADEEFQGLTVRVDMLRSSVLLDAALSGDGNIRVAGAVANHSSDSTTSHYTEKLPLRIMYEHKVRKFQKLFQATIVMGVEGAAQRLGISEDEVKKLVEQAVSTGLGRMCLKPFAGIQPGTIEGEACTRLNACHSCEAIYLIVDAELIADLIIWHGSLREASEALAAERPERFEAEWADDLAWCETAIETFQRGPARRVFVQAEALAKARLATPGFVAPKPW